MAERVLTEGLISSESANNLTDAAERLFGRILATSTTDAWGRRDAALRKLRADCIPLLDWTDEKLMESLEELVREGICELYCVDGRYYIRVCNWDLYQRNTARLRKGRSRFPDPPLPHGDDIATSERSANERGASAGRPGLISAFGSASINPSDGSSDQSRLRLGSTDSSENTTDESAVDDEEAKGSLGWVVQQIPDSTRRTPAAIATVVRKYRLPQAALQCALEEMRVGGKKINNKAAFVVSRLEMYGKEGRYA